MHELAYKTDGISYIRSSNGEIYKLTHQSLVVTFITKRLSFQVQLLFAIKRCTEQKIWKVIKENKDLDLPAHEVMVVTVRCKKIANEKYDAQATYFDEGVRTRKREQLEEKLLQLVQPAFQALLGHIRSGSLDKFKGAFDKTLNGEEAFSVAACNCSESFMALFDEGCAANWDTSKVRDQLKRDIEAHIASVCAAKLSELTALYEEEFEWKKKLKGNKKNWRMPYQDRLEALLDGVNGETWPSIRNLFRRETESAVSGISSASSGFDMDEQSKGKTLTSLEAYAIVRLEDYAADNIENTLSLALMASTNAAAEDRSITTADPLASSTWQEVSSSKTLIKPVECKSLWRQFKRWSEHSVSMAVTAQVGIDSKF
ncbi:hypothetical protein PRUPE_3G005800 [Prunus persica]|uniref:Sey1/RHD3-like three-helix bundle domain-containing protein n=1 Tax=Prunus persica TaxID=3760 RepID=A0A251PWB8_PRUPE|nr:hypothetical protein PRUPE_3G005800 [Prunus persica]